MRRVFSLHIILLLILLTSCGGHLQITNKGCASKKTVFSDQDDEVIYTGGFWLPVFSNYVRKVSLSDILKEKKIDCSQLKTVSYEVGHNLIDSVLSFIPLLGRSHVIVRGSYN